MSDRSWSLLVVDDDPLSCDMLSRRLTRKGFDVSVSESGAEAWRKIQERRIDLVLLDVEMPGANGYEVLKMIRNTYAPTILPVIMVTGKTDSEEIVKALSLGANDYLTKPIDLPVALARIQTQLSYKKSQDALRESEERYQLAARGANDGLWDWNLTTNEIFYSVRWKAMLGWEDQDVSNSPAEWFQRMHPEDVQGFQQAMAAHLEGSTPHFERECRMRHRDGAFLWTLVRGLAVRDGQGKAYRLAGSQTDITEGKLGDVLTGLPNKLLFLDRLGLALRRSERRRDYTFAVIFLDLDNFKLVNDSHGHLAGDTLLRGVAGRLRSCLRSEDLLSRLETTDGGSRVDNLDLVARFGGDEFAVLLEGIRTPADAVRVAERIGTELRAPFPLDGGDIFTSASMGIAMSATGYHRPEDVLRDADTAMYRAKGKGKGGYELFDDNMRASAITRLQLETELRKAVDNRQFEHYYQVITDISNGRIRGFEALARWHHPTHGTIEPAEFIGVAEESGLISHLDHLGLQAACLQTRKWHERFPGEPPLMISVNLSAKNFMRSSLLEEIELILKETGLPPQCLILEVTESAAFTDPTTGLERMKRLKSLGLQIALDDFGTGYSSLTYLHRFPVCALKIDRSFLFRMTESRSDTEIVRTIVTLGHNLGLKVIAEGVEKEEQLTVLQSMGVELAQGYYFSKPISAEAVTAQLLERRQNSNGGAQGILRWSQIPLLNNGSGMDARPASLALGK